VILVGHAYGGVVVTEAGRDPKVAGLVYVAAFVPDAGESAYSLLASQPPGSPIPPILPPEDGLLRLDPAQMHASFAGDLPAEKAAFMADSQVPWSLTAVADPVGVPAWKEKRSWYLVATEDRMIPPELQRAMARRAGATVIEASGSHSIQLSHPDVVAALIAKATAETMAPRPAAAPA
jgi:pimeloyl-ACP methyl ester carboxylesterase